MKSLRKSHLSIAVAAALSTSLTSGIVLAQEGADDEVLTTEEVLVTGSRIATVDGFGATSPVTVVNAEEIANLGFVNIEQVGKHGAPCEKAPLIRCDERTNERLQRQPDCTGD